MLRNIAALFRLRDYGADGQIGLEETPDAYVAKLVEVFREVRRVLKKDGTLWLNLGDSYAGSGKGPTGNFNDHGERHLEHLTGGLRYGLKPKDLIGIPWRVAFALQADGWWLRQDIIWSKPSPMPESVRDRCTKAHEYIFLLSKSAKYFYDADAIAERSIHYGSDARSDKGNIEYREGKRKGDTGTGQHAFVTVTETRNKRSVWTITTKPYSEAHFATFPIELPTLCIKAGSREGDTILDPFNGAGSTGVAALNYGRNYIGIELNAEYITLTERRLNRVSPLFTEAQT